MWHFDAPALDRDLTAVDRGLWMRLGFDRGLDRGWKEILQKKKKVLTALDRGPASGVDWVDFVDRVDRADHGVKNGFDRGLWRESVKRQIVFESDMS